MKAEHNFYIVCTKWHSSTSDSSDSQQMSVSSVASASFWDQFLGHLLVIEINMHEKTWRWRQWHAWRCLDVRWPGVAWHVISPDVVFCRLVMFTADGDDRWVINGQKVTDWAAGQCGWAKNCPLVSGNVVPLHWNLCLLMEWMVNSDAANNVQNGVVWCGHHCVKSPRAVHWRTVDIDASRTCQRQWHATYTQHVEGSRGMLDVLKYFTHWIIHQCIHKHHQTRCHPNGM